MVGLCCFLPRFPFGWSLALRSDPRDPKQKHDPPAQQATGTDFDTVQRFWVGEAFRCLGAAVRSKKVAFLGVKVRTPRQQIFCTQVILMAFVAHRCWNFLSL